MTNKDVSTYFFFLTHAPLNLSNEEAKKVTAKDFQCSIEDVEDALRKGEDYIDRTLTKERKMLKS